MMIEDEEMIEENNDARHAGPGAGISSSDPSFHLRSAFAEAAAPGVARIRPAVFRPFPTPLRDTPTSAPAHEGLATRRSTAHQAYGATTGLSAATPRATGSSQDMAATRSNGSRHANAGAIAPGQGAPGQPGSRPTAARVSSSAELEQQLTPLRGLAHDLVTRGMPSGLVGELLAEIVAEYGNQVLVSEYDARLALLEQLLLRITCPPLLTPGEPLLGAYIIAGPSGSGKSTLIAHLVFAAVQQGQSDIVLVNTESERIGAAAQMDALGKVFGCEVVHIYTAQELRDIHAQCGPQTLLLVEAAGGTAMTTEARLRNAWTWRLPFSRYVVCVPATAQGEDIQDLLAGAKQITSDPAAVLAKVSETRNALPALGALASVRQPVAMVVPGPNLADPTPPPELAAVARAALGAVKRPRK